MKIKYYIFFLGLIFSLVSCEIDNYDEPQSIFTGNVVYNGEAIQVGAREVRFQLWQPGFGNLAPLDVHLDIDGSFSGRFYNGDYKLKFLDGQGPFKAKFVSEQAGDTIFIKINGSTQMDLEVLPYYMVRNSQFSVSGSSITGSADLEKVITDADARDIEFANIYINDTEFVSNNDDYNIAQMGAAVDVSTGISGVVEIPGDYNKPYVFARIGVKIAGVEDLIFSSVQKLSL
ncbi:MAG: DUF3823 domain-containing protein [Leeuwenhoekiella sp.]